MISLYELRQYKLFGIALFDLILTFITAFLFESYFIKTIGIPKEKYYLSIIPIGVLAHLLFNQHTFLNKQLFYSNDSFNIYQLFFLVNLIMLIF